MRGFAGVVLGLWTGLALQPALAAGPGPELRAEAAQFAVNNTLSALYHEFGHLFIDQFQLPILGREEDAADAIATLMLLRDGSEASAVVSYDTVDGYFLSSQLYGEENGGNDLSDQHALDVQRAYQMACLLVGGNPAQFEGLAEQIGFEAERIEACGIEYELARRGWSRMMAGHLRGLGSGGGAAITFHYGPASGALGDIAALLKSRRVLEHVSDKVTRQFLLARPATVRAIQCDEENAFYDPHADEITICYEYARFYYDLIASPAGTVLAEEKPRE